MRRASHDSRLVACWVVASEVQGSTSGKEHSRPTCIFTNYGLFCGENKLSFFIMQKHYAICFRIESGNRVSVFVAPCAVKYIFTVIVLVFIKDGHAFDILKSVISR